MIVAHALRDWSALAYCNRHPPRKKLNAKVPGRGLDDAKVPHLSEEPDVGVCAVLGSV